MKKQSFLILVGLLGSAGVAAAQQPGLTAGQQPPQSVDGGIRFQPAVSGYAPSSSSTAPTFWLGTDYLLWWIKKDPNNVPLVTTGPYNPNTYNPATDPVPGALGSPGTVVLRGNKPIEFGAFSGLRLNAGLALDAESVFALEGSAFLLEQRSNSFVATSNASGTPFIGRPTIGSISGQENTVGVAFQDDAANTVGGASGSIAVNNTTRLWGNEANLTARLYGNNGLTVVALLGFRYIDLDESLNIVENDVNIGLPGFFMQNGVTGTANAAVGDSIIVADNFHTRNQFYGGQVGAKVGYAVNGFDVNVVGKVALGDNVERVAINGSSVYPTAGLTAVGGVLAEPSNIGVFHHSEFSVIPEVGITVGYQITSWLRAEVGYSFLYWNQVMRPEGAIDRVVDQAQVPTSQYYSSGAAGTRPLPQFNQSDFWAQGVNFGLGINF